MVDLMYQCVNELPGISFIARGFDEILGPPERRYFGSGFRRVSHFVDAVAVSGEQARIEVSAVGAAVYPPDWSLDAAGRPRDVHLSSFDAIALTAATLRAAAASHARLRALLGSTVTRLHVRAPSQVVPDVREVPVALAWTDGVTGAAPGHVVSRVGRFTVRLDVDTNALSERPVDQQLHQDRHGVVLYSGRVLAASDSELVTVQTLATEAEPLTCVEELAMFGQLSQIAVYATKGLDRKLVPNLWLRHLALHRSSLRPDPTIRTVTSITRHRLLNAGGANLADVGLTSRASYGALAEAAFAYRVPS